MSNKTQSKNQNSSLSFKIGLHIQSLYILECFLILFHIIFMFLTNNYSAETNLLDKNPGIIKLLLTSATSLSVLNKNIDYLYCMRVKIY